MKSKFYRALSFSRGEWWMLTRAWVLLLLVDLGLRFLPFRRVQKILAPGQQNPGKHEYETEQILPTIQYLKRWVNAATRHHLYPMTCLRRSLVLQRLLSQRGIAVDLQIGVRLEGDKLNAHAWLEYHGLPIGERESIAEQYAPLAAPGVK